MKKRIAISCVILALTTSMVVLPGTRVSTGTTTTFTAILTGDQETPPNDSPATGVGTFILNDAQDALKFDVCYFGLTGDFVSGAHFHVAPPGVAGPIVRGTDVTDATVPDGMFSDVWTSTDPMPLTPELVDELFAGNIYFNIHTPPNFLGGEIRGQLEVSDDTNACTSGSTASPVTAAHFHTAPRGMAATR